MHATQIRHRYRTETPSKTNIRLRIYPQKRAILPPGLTVAVLDEAKNPVLDESKTPLEIYAREADNFIQLALYGSPGECFKVKITLEDVSIIEDFII